MDDKLKQRIVGAMVIFALAAIILPIVLDDSKSQQRFESKVPPRPRLDNTQTAIKPVAGRPQTDAQLATNSPDDVEPDKGISPSRDVLSTPIDTTPVGANDETAAPVTTLSAADRPTAPSNSNDKVEDTVDSSSQTASLGNPSPTAQNDNENRSAPPPADLGFTSNAWVIQVGSFSDSGNASKLVTKLKQSGFKAFARRYQLAQGSATRVFVGPDLDKSDLEKQLDDLNEATGMKAIVVKFDPSVH